MCVCGGGAGEGGGGRRGRVVVVVAEGGGGWRGVGRWRLKGIRGNHPPATLVSVYDNAHHF